MMTTPPLVQVRALHKRFGQVVALDGISLDLLPGEVHGFIGPNGAGKTTAMRIMAGVESPDAGDVLLDGTSVMQHPEAGRQRIGFMPDYLDSYPGVLVWEYLDFYSRIAGFPPERRMERGRDVVDFTGLNGHLAMPVEGLSKGWKQRLSLARVLLNDPDVLILDEPAAGLDPRARIELREMVTELARHGKAIFISSHILGELAEMCTAVSIIEEGRLVTSGSMDGLQTRVDNGRRVAVRLVGGDDGERRRLALLLAGLPGVTGAAEEADGATFTYDGDDGFRADVLARLVNEGFRVGDFHKSSSSLEDAFMAVTGQSEKEG
ncbi:MAG: ABC transporter ATP-binding protein [Planctomycetaceae bacterium]|nr:ABC transporter ATP-binding protein [Planctomycetaceae bacterium]